MLSGLHKLHGIQLEDYYELGTWNGIEGRSCGSFYDTAPTFNWKRVLKHLLLLWKISCIYIVTSVFQFLLPEPDVILWNYDAEWAQIIGTIFCDMVQMRYNLTFRHLAISYIYFNNGLPPDVRRRQCTEFSHTEVHKLYNRHHWLRFPR